jgi:hypothetical protein
MGKFSAMMAIMLLCLAQNAQADEISVTNRNCVFQGFSRTNQAKFHISTRVEGTREAARGCADHWVTVGAGKTETIAMPPLSDCTYFYCKAGCYYTVEAEGVPVVGKAGSKFMCALDWADICQCQPQ